MYNECRLAKLSSPSAKQSRKFYFYLNVVNFLTAMLLFNFQLILLVRFADWNGSSQHNFLIKSLSLVVWYFRALEISKGLLNVSTGS